MASAVGAAIAEEEKALGDVVDEYFSFIYEEPTDDTFSDFDGSTDGNEILLSEDFATVENAIYQNLRPEVNTNSFKREVVSPTNQGSPGNQLGKRYITNWEQQRSNGHVKIDEGDAESFRNTTENSESCRNSTEDFKRLSHDDFKSSCVINGGEVSLKSNISSPAVSIAVTPSPSQGNISSSPHNHSTVAGVRKPSSVTVMPTSDSDEFNGSATPNRNWQRKSVINVASNEQAWPSSSSASGSKASTSITPISREGAHSIYVYNSDPDSSNSSSSSSSVSRATSVYLNGEHDHDQPEEIRECRKPAIPVTTIKISPEMRDDVTGSCFDVSADGAVLDDKDKDSDAREDFEKFLEELCQPGSVNRDTEKSVNNNDLTCHLGGDVLNGVLNLCGEDLVFDSTSGCHEDKVLDIGSIECDILSELCDDIASESKVPEEKVQKPFFSISPYKSELRKPTSRPVEVEPALSKFNPVEDLTTKDRYDQVFGEPSPKFLLGSITDGVEREEPSLSSTLSEPTSGSNSGTADEEDCDEVPVESWRYVPNALETDVSLGDLKSSDDCINSPRDAVGGALGEPVEGHDSESPIHDIDVRVERPVDSDISMTRAHGTAVKSEERPVDSEGSLNPTFVNAQVSDPVVRDVGEDHLSFLAALDDRVKDLMEDQPPHSAHKGESSSVHASAVLQPSTNHTHSGESQFFSQDQEEPLSFDLSLEQSHRGNLSSLQDKETEPVDSSSWRETLPRGCERVSSSLEMSSSTCQSPTPTLDFSWQEVGSVDQVDERNDPERGELSADHRSEAIYDTDEDDIGGTGLAAAVSRVVRRSMRRMRRLRLSGRRSSHRNDQREECRPPGITGMSEETEVRRDLPSAPSVGLSTVRSPAAASIIVTSLVAALAPPPLNSPREILQAPPGQHTPNHSAVGSSSERTPASNENDNTVGGGGRRRRSRHNRGDGGRGRRHESPSTPTAPTSLEVEVGGYSPSAPISLDSYSCSCGSSSSGPPSCCGPPSAPPSLDLSPASTWQAAAVIPRPSFTTSSHHSRRSNSHTHNNSTLSTEPSSTSSSREALQVGGRERGARGGGGSEEGGGEEGGNGGGGSGGNGGSGDGGGERGSVVVEGTQSTGPARNPTGRRRTRRRHEPSASDSNNNTNNNNNNNNNSTNTATPTVTSPISNNNSESNNTRNNNRNENSSSNNNNSNNNSSQQSPRRSSPRRNAHVGGVSVEDERLRVQGGTWTHNHSALMASLAVTVTTFNISRFAVLGARFGWPFVVQWVVVSVVLGLPLMTFHVTVGQYLGAGVVDMWRISPIFQGVGYSVVAAQAVVGVYCCVPVSWLFIFFRDSFITHNNMFRWADCRLVNCSVFHNFSTIIIEGVPKYFNSQVLQRSDGESTWLQELGSIKFDMAVNIALIWIITLIALSRGNQSYGKVCYMVFLLPLLGYLIVCLYLASWTKDDLYINHVKNFNEFFMNSRSWMAASREVFLVWGFHGAVLQQMAAHNKQGHPLHRDTTILAVITTLVLVLAAVTGSSCVSGLHQNNLHYKPSSFETTESAQFLSETQYQSDMMTEFETFFKHFHMGNVPPQFLAEYMHHDNFYAGIRIRPPKVGSVRRINAEKRSGYQSLRLATELFPAILAVNGAQEISPFWSSLFYFSLLLFGIAQQLAVWRTVVEAVIRINRERLQAWETFITFLCCVFGLSAALPMATGAGIQILYFLDYVVSCSWWLMIIQLVQIFALLFVRGKPYSGQDIVGELMGKNEQCRSLWLGPLTSFAWNIIVPVGLLVLSISSFKSGQFRDVFAWGSDSYWPVWACQLASALQLFPILLVPLVGLIQTCRYLAATDDDLFEKIQLLYRPSLRQRNIGSNSFLSTAEDPDGGGLGGTQEGEDETGTTTPRPYSDPPPKYTPPPSYSTATGVRFAKLLNQSLRQSMRRLRDTLRSGTEVGVSRDTEGSSQGGEGGRSAVAPGRTNTPYIPPPDYVTAVSECTTQPNRSSSSTEPPPQYSTLDPLRRQQALAALANSSASSSHPKADDETEQPLPTTPSVNRDNSLHRSGLRRSIASGVRRSARRLAATLGVRGSEDGATLVSSEAPLGQDRDSEISHPYAYTNFELVSQSDA